MKNSCFQAHHSQARPFQPLPRRFDGAPQFFFAADDGANLPGGDNGSASGTTPTDSNQAQPQLSVKDAVAETIADLLGRKGGDKDAALETMIRKNYRLEQRAEAAEKAALSAAERADFQAGRDLMAAYGAKNFAELKTKLDEGQTAIAERDGMKKSAQMREAVEAAGFDFDDFSSRKGVDDWTYEVKDENRDGKTVKVPYVTFELDGRAQTKPLAEHATSVFPTLAKAENKSDQRSGSAKGRAWTKQGVDGSGAETAAERIRRQEQERRSHRNGRADASSDGEERPSRRTIFDKRRR